ncbi:hypothetical protein [Calothrix sp. PCC 6303]|nr:hypothetical protein [Calothrix sp. PCC 6303]
MSNRIDTCLIVKSSARDGNFDSQINLSRVFLISRLVVCQDLIDG